MSIKVLVVDDSALVRSILSDVLNADPELTVVGTANDPYQARERIKQLDPDVLTLDIEMPRMDGVTFLRKLMKLHPMPVVMCSTLTEKSAAVTLEALEIGAFDFVTKPTVDVARNLQGYGEELCAKVRGAYRAGRRSGPGVSAAPASTTLKVAPSNSADIILPAVDPRSIAAGARPIIAIGSSTGGTEAVRRVFEALPSDLPGIVVAQHIPPSFSRSFAERLNQCSKLTVCEAQEGQPIEEGHAYVAPGDRHLLVRKEKSQYVCRLDAGPRVNRHQPSVDVLFRSTCQAAGASAVGVILTGMGDDGARCLKELRDCGAHTIAQDEATSVVWGMPGEAVKMGGAVEVLPLMGVSDQLIRRFSKVSR